MSQENEDINMTVQDRSVSITPIGHLARPITILINYRVIGLSLSILTAALSIVGLWQLEQISRDSIIDICIAGDVPVRAERILLKLALILCWIPALPLLATAALFPLRVIFRFGDVTLSHCITEFPGAFRSAVQGMWASWRALIALTIPLFSVMILISEARDSNKLQAVLPPLILVAALLSIIIVWKIILPIVSIPVAITTDIHPHRVILSGNTLLFGGRRIACLVIVTLLLLTLGLFFSILTGTLTIFEITSHQAIIALLSVLGLIIWYLTMFLAILCLDATVAKIRHERGEAK